MSSSAYSCVSIQVVGWLREKEIAFWCWLVVATHTHTHHRELSRAPLPPSPALHAARSVFVERRLNAGAVYLERRWLILMLDLQPCAKSGRVCWEAGVLGGLAVDSLAISFPSPLWTYLSSSQLVTFFFYWLVANGYIYECVCKCLSARGGWPAKKDVSYCTKNTHARTHGATQSTRTHAHTLFFFSPRGGHRCRHVLGFFKNYLPYMVCGLLRAMVEREGRAGRGRATEQYKTLLVYGNLEFSVFKTFHLFVEKNPSSIHP